MTKQLSSTKGIRTELQYNMRCYTTSRRMAFMRRKLETYSWMMWGSFRSMMKELQNALPHYNILACSFSGEGVGNFVLNDVLESFRAMMRDQVDGQRLYTSKQPCWTVFGFLTVRLADFTQSRKATLPPAFAPFVDDRSMGVGPLVQSPARSKRQFTVLHEFRILCAPKSCKLFGSTGP